MNLEPSSSWRSLWLGLALSVPLLLLWESSGLDLHLTRAFGDAQGFALRENWWLKQVAHDGARMLAWLGIGLWLAVLIPPQRPGWPTRGARLYWLLVALVCALVVSGLKQLSGTSCPWDMAEFGGGAQSAVHWLNWRFLGSSDGGPGRCFPSGHAVSAFAYFALCFLLWPHRPWLARRLFVTVCVLGLLFGAVQLLRGAHHASHVFWSGWLSLAVCCTAQALAQTRWRMRRSMPHRERSTPNLQTPGPRGVSSRSSSRSW
jgi:membrane-associated PAP2 superfamily phosphatase